MNLTTEYTSWYLILCAALAGLYTFLLYYRNSQVSELSIGKIRLLSVLRFVSVFSIAALLLNPFFQKNTTTTQPAKIVVALDISSSIVNNEDSTFYKNDFLQQWSNLKESLTENFEVEELYFGDEVLESNPGNNYFQKRTNYTQLFREIEARYASENLGALIIATDGLYNSGGNPLYYNFKHNFNIHTIGLGDTLQYSDLSITELRSNKIAYLGNKFPLEVNIKADLLDGEEIELKLIHKGKLIDQTTTNVSGDRFGFSHRFIITADEQGTQNYRVVASTRVKEFNEVNNVQYHSIEIIDNRDKILILASNPHPDVSAIRSALELKESYEVDVVLAREFTADINAYNLVIAHGFGDGLYQDKWSNLWNSKVPIWAVVKGNVNVQNINQLAPGFQLDGGNARANSVSGLLNSSFNNFKVSPELNQLLSKVPPVNSPFAEIAGAQESGVLMYQKLGAVETSFPLFYFDDARPAKTAWFFADGIWRWKLYDYKENQNHNQFNQLIWKTAQYLALKEDKSRFRVRNKKRVYEVDDIKFEAEYYDKSYEQKLDQEILLRVKNNVEDEFNYAFKASNIGYGLNLGKLSAGEYTYVASISDGLESFSRRGSFTVLPVDIEFISTVANFNVLKDISSATNGKFFPVGDINKVRDEFEDKSKYPNLTYTYTTKEGILHQKWIFGLILLLLSLEWFLRKRFGRY